jgi:hypothetical protein
MFILATIPISFNGGFIQYKLNERTLRQMMFQPVDIESLVDSDDLLHRLRIKRTIADVGQWIELDVRTLSTYALIMFASSDTGFAIIQASANSHNTHISL